MKKTTKTILKKKGGEKIAMLTAYDAPFAALADAADVDIILIGDSVGNTVLGYQNTVPVTIDDMAHHTAAVARAKPNALIVADLPFASAHHNFDRLLDDCVRLVRSGADAVKIEGGADMAEKISRLTKAGIAVMGHIGLEPQQVLKLGGYRKFGKTEAEKAAILADAKALEAAGVFVVLMEMTDAECAKAVTEAVSVPTIGIGAGADCDGQVLVLADVIGFSENPPSFAKRYANVGEIVRNAFSEFVADVRNGRFPEKR